VKEQIEEEHAKSEETMEETPSDLKEIRKTSFVTEPAPEPLSIERSPEQQSSSPRAHFTFGIPTKRIKHPGASQPRPPCLKVIISRFVRLGLLSTKIETPVTIAPAISVAPKTIALKDLRIPTLTPVSITRVIEHPLRLRLKRPLDISIRPIISIEPIKVVGPSTPLVKPTQIAFQRPRLIPIFRRCSSITCMPRVRPLALKEEMRERPQSVYVPEPTRGVKATAGSEEPFLGEVENVFELFLDEKSGKGIGEVVRYPGESVYIVLEKPLQKEHTCLDTLHYLCLRALREYSGKAETRALSSEYGKSEVEKYLGDRSITIVDEKLLLKRLGICYRNTGGELSMEIDERSLADRLKNFSKDLSYIIFYVEAPKAWLLYQKLWKFRSTFHDKIFYVAPKPALTIDTIQKLARVFWGFVDIPPSGSCDGLFGSGKVTYYQTLDRTYKIVRAKPEKPYPIPRTHSSGSESREHLLIKGFLAKCLVDSPPEELWLQKIEKKDRYKYIEFEKTWKKENGIIAVSDAFLVNDGIAIEIETLFEEGKYSGEPIAKIRDETVEKYREIQINQLWIIMENLTMLKHLRDLWVLRDLYRQWYEEEGKIHFKVKFFTLNLKDEKLVQMEELTSHLYKILKDLQLCTANLPGYVNTWLEKV